MGNKNCSCSGEPKSQIKSLKSKIVQQEDTIQRLKKQVAVLNNVYAGHNNEFGYGSPSSSSYSLSPLSYTPLSPLNISKDCNQCHKGHRIETCEHLRSLTTIMKQYTDENEQIFDDDTIQTATNNFIHLVIHHDSDAEFEHVMRAFGACDILMCKMIKRNFRVREYRSKQLNNLYYNADKMKIVHCQIYDSIHSYYSHCHDIGNKLLSKDRKAIEEHGKNNCLRFYGKNKQLLRIVKLLSAKRKRCKHVLAELQNREKKTFGTYSFGQQINYWYDSEHHEISVTVRKKYGDLREELLNNPISCISIKQFEIELEKARIKFNSQHRREFYVDMKSEHILALMLYCDYTSLQCAFSKTYRDNNIIKDHNNFYHWAKWLKKAVKEFGTEIRHGKIKSFYHGISQQLLLPSIITDIKIYCPLSTSSSLAVAANFASHSKGLVFEFQGGGELQQVKYFSLNWLSDFNESECLFIQNYHTLKIANVCDLTNGFEYRNVLFFLQIIDEMICEIKYEKAVSKTMEESIKAIVTSQVNKTWNKSCLPLYGQHLIDVYFFNRKKLIINKNCKNRSFFYQLFGLPKLDMVYLLCPNVQLIEIYNDNNIDIITQKK